MAGSLKEFLSRLFGRRKASSQTEAAPPSETPSMPTGPASTEGASAKPSGDGGGEQAPPSDTS
jgi:hypothetical protein